MIPTLNEIAELFEKYEGTGNSLEFARVILKLINKEEAFINENNKPIFTPLAPAFEKGSITDKKLHGILYSSEVTKPSDNYRDLIKEEKTRKFFNKKKFWKNIKNRKRKNT